MNEPKKDEPQLDLAEAVRQISAAMQRLLKSGLNKKAITVLLKHETGVPMGHINAVLAGLDNLARVYTRG